MSDAFAHLPAPRAIVDCVGKRYVVLAEGTVVRVDSRKSKRRKRIEARRLNAGTRPTHGEPTSSTIETATPGQRTARPSGQTEGDRYAR